MDVRKSVLVGHSAERMFDVIEAAEHYPDFLPWCAGAVIVARDATEVIADLTVNFHGIRFGFRTRNPKRRPERMAIHLERGPFRHFDGLWELTPLSADGCRVDFGLHYDFDSTPMSTLARPLFDRIANTLVDRFVARADVVDATRGPPAPTTAPTLSVSPRSDPQSVVPPAAPTRTGPGSQRPADGSDPVNNRNPS